MEEHFFIQNLFSAIGKMTINLKCMSDRGIEEDKVNNQRLK